MAPHIQKISGRIPDTETQLNISLDGKNLIITGTNGSGKTWFLRQLHNNLSQKLMIMEPSLTQLYNELSELTARIDQSQNDEFRHSNIRAADTLRHQINHYESRICLDIDQAPSNEASQMIMFFEAERKSSISPAASISSVDISKAQWRSSIEQNFVGTTLEQHLANLKSRAAIVARYENNEEYAKSIDEWFINQELNLKLLMEDDSTKLVYDPKKDTFTITREGKRDTNFQSLSSGYSSVFSIYSEILMRTEVLDILPAEFKGVAFIDEIETHLHVSLQRLILPFFKNAFPNIQFIITTHSPFILTSTTDAVVYDISANTVIDADLSLFTYAAVMQGVLNTRATSVVLENIVKKISKIINSNPVDTLSLRAELHKLHDSFDLLDSRAKTFYRLGEKALTDSENGNVQG